MKNLLRLALCSLSLLSATFAARADVIGMGLDSVLIDPNFQGFYSEYTLSGNLLDNTVLADRLSEQATNWEHYLRVSRPMDG